MSDLLEALPKDSCFHLWLASRAIIETPVSFDLACCMTAFGSLFKRSIWIDQVRWKVYANMSTLLVGGSGVGKNTAIDGASEILDHFGVPTVGGKTIETITDQLFKIGDPAAAVLKAEELSDFIGKKDYQQGLLQGLTDLLDTKAWKDIRLKSDPHPRRIANPTVSILAGSTPEWLHTALPPEAMDGGFFPRFVIVCDSKVKRLVPLVKSLPRAEVAAAITAGEAFYLQALGHLKAIYDHGEYTWGGEAEGMYNEWYATREQAFSHLANAYAHRCRDHVLRIAMLCAASRGGALIEEPDVGFALAFISFVAARIDKAMAIPNRELACASTVLEMLPCHKHKVFFELSKGYPSRVIKDSIGLLYDSGQIQFDGDNLVPKERQ